MSYAEDLKFWRSFGLNPMEEYMRNWRRTHSENCREYVREYRQELKAEVLTHYGNGKLACVRCGYSDVRALSIDHINGGGTQEIRDFRGAGQTFYSHLRKLSYPEGYQTLCMNCQWIKRDENGECVSYDRKRMVGAQK